MYSPLTYLILLVWLVGALVDYASFCRIWQLSEYRRDRFRNFTTTQQGKRFAHGYLMLWRPLALLVLLIVSLYFDFDAKFLVFIVLAFEAMRYGYQARQQSLKLPERTAKAVLIIIFAIIFEALVLWLIAKWPFVFLLMILRFIIITLTIRLLAIPTKLAKKYYINQAANKLSRYQDIAVVGITGSYGKSTVKYFLTQILEKKLKVLMTPKNINTDIGIAKFILETDLNGIEVLVVEMAAYKLGEIKIIADMVKPKVGILTAINEQHLALFGSLENTQKAKYELLRALPENGLAIVNSDNKYCREYLGELKCEVKTFGQDIQHNPTFLVDDKLAQLVPGGDHNAMNVAPCIIAAEQLNFTKDEILPLIKDLSLPDNTTEIVNYGQAIIINDSYNANPAGFKAALAILDKYGDEYEKTVITRGMLELGNYSQQLHKEIGENIARIADRLIVITPDFKESLREGIHDSDQVEIKEIYNSEELLKYIKSQKGIKNVILLENRVPDNIMREIAKKEIS